MQSDDDDDGGAMKYSPISSPDVSCPLRPLHFTLLRLLTSRSGASFSFGNEIGRGI